MKTHTNPSLSAESVHIFSDRDLNFSPLSIRPGSTNQTNNSLAFCRKKKLIKKQNKARSMTGGYATDATRQLVMVSDTSRLRSRFCGTSLSSPWRCIRACPYTRSLLFLLLLSFFSLSLSLAETTYFYK